MHNNQNNHINAKFQIEERIRKVASLIAQSMTETEIAKELGVMIIGIIIIIENDDLS